MGRVSDARQRLIDAAIDLIGRHGYTGTTVDSICDKARVNKGSFYHFFHSKDDLVVAALDRHWENRMADLDRLFSAAVPPLERLQNYFQNVYERQTQLKASTGQYGGCIYSSIGSECVEQSPAISRKVQEILSTYARYYESALRDAQAEGLVRIKDLPGKAKSLFAYMEGVLSQAKIQDDPALLRNFGTSAFEFLGLQRHRKLKAS
jgi:TetR/AcrR family transcriptional regulator, transcriptional repressor for nem operon